MDSQPNSKSDELAVKMAASTIREESKLLIQEYLDQNRSHYSKQTLINHFFYCNRFVRFLESEGVNELSNLDFKSLLKFHRFLSSKNRPVLLLTEGCIKKFLSYLEEKGIIHFGLGWYLNFLSQKNFEYFEELLQGDDIVLEMSKDITATLTPDEFLQLTKTIIRKVLESREQTEDDSLYKRAMQVFYLFLTINGFCYSPELAEIWLMKNRHLFRSSYWIYQRTLRLLEKYLITKEIPVYGNTQKYLRIYDDLPEWCKLAINEFLELRRKEKMEESTLDMDQWSCSRFCAFLCDENFNSFDQITHKIVRKFNLEDKHETMAGKNAMNSHVKNFLKFLERKEYTSFSGLYLSLYPSKTKSGKRVVILNENEINDLKTQLNQAETPSEIRDKAIILLGSELGLRASDIANLKIRNINWNEKSIRLIQKKTGQEIILPMPNIVGNAIYRYLKEARPRNVNSDSVFLTVRKPFNPVNSGIVANSMKRILPDSVTRQIILQ